MWKGEIDESDRQQTERNVKILFLSGNAEDGNGNFQKDRSGKQGAVLKI